MTHAALPVRLWAVLALICCFFIAVKEPAVHASEPVSSSDPSDRTDLAEATASAFYGSGIPAETVIGILRSEARLNVLKKAVMLIDRDVAARMGVTETRAGTSPGKPPYPPEKRMLALASAVFPVSIAVLSSSPAQGGTFSESEGQIHVTARIPASPRDPLHTLRLSLRDRDNLELRHEALQRIQTAVHEGRELLSDTAGLRRFMSDGKDGAQTSRRAAQAENLGRRLEALETYLELLRDFKQTWLAPHEAAPILEHLSRLDPSNPLIWMGLAEAMLLMERPYEAMDAIRTATALHDVPPRAFYVRGLAYLRLHLPANAVKDFNEAIALQPEKAAWWRARGAARLLSEEEEAMCPDFYQACALGDCEGLVEVRKRGFCLEN